MGRKRTEREGSFSAKDEKGNWHVVDVFVDILDAGTMTDPHAETKGLKSLKTRNGLSINRLEKGKYQIVQSGVLLTSDDPEAV